MIRIPSSFLISHYARDFVTLLPNWLPYWVAAGEHRIAEMTAVLFSDYYFKKGSRNTVVLPPSFPTMPSSIYFIMYYYFLARRRALIKRHLYCGNGTMSKNEMERTEI